jgi:uncharacterized protein (DUF302 family)
MLAAAIAETDVPVIVDYLVKLNTTKSQSMRALAKMPSTVTARAKLFALIVVICLQGVHAMAAEGLITLRSNYGPKDTMDRLEAAVRAKDLTVFAHIDHAAGAAAVGLPLRPTDLLIFGNARGGTPLMQSAQTIGIDLPLKTLVWQDATGATWLSYNDPSWLAKRHGLGADAEATVGALTTAMHAVAKAATGSQ